MDQFSNLKWYNFLIIILLIIITVAIILLPTSEGQMNKTSVCPLQCTRREQFCEVPTVTVKPTVTPQEKLKGIQTKIQQFQPEKPPVLVNEPKHEMILYYAAWCGYSRSFLPEWQKFLDWAKVNLPNVRCDNIRCEDGLEAECQQKGISGYPTVMLYLIDGSSHKFTGPRTVDGLQKFAYSFI